MIAPKTISIERRLSELVRDTEGLTFGYIGNFERWGDDRLLIIWVDGATREKNGNKMQLWQCPATSLTPERSQAAHAAIKGFKIGFKLGTKSC